MKEKRKNTIYYILILLIGIIIGGNIFSNTQPRSIIALKKCEKCYKTNDLIGLLVSVGINKTPIIIPNVIYETDKTIVIKHPFPEAPIHYLVIPKKDIKDIKNLSKDDSLYITDAYSVMSKIIRDQNLTDYRIITNGPGFQQATYLHFHLRANK